MRFVPRSFVANENTWRKLATASAEGIGWCRLLRLLFLRQLCCSLGGIRHRSFPVSLLLCLPHCHLFAQLLCLFFSKLQGKFPVLLILGHAWLGLLCHNGRWLRGYRLWLLLFLAAPKA